MLVCPILLTEPSLALPPVDRCRGMRPSQAAKLRPLSNVTRSGAKGRGRLREGAESYAKALASDILR